jgi:predicted MFS family arabinose efflux permease
MPVGLRRFLGEGQQDAVHDHIARLTVARWAANLCSRVIPPYLGVIAASIGVPLTTIGVASGISEFTGLAGPAIGHAVERRPRRSAMAFGLFALAIGALFTAGGTHVVPITVGFIVISLSKEVFDNGMGAWVADHTTFATRGRVSGLTEVSWSTAALIGLPVLGVIAGLTSWRLAFVAAALFAAVAAVHLRAKLPPEPSAHEDTPRHRLRLDRTNVGGFAVFGVLLAAANCLFVTFGSWLQDRFQVSDASLGILGLAFGTAELLAAVLSAAFVDRVGKRRAITIGAAFMIPAALALSTARNLPVAVVYLAIFFFGFEIAIVSFVPLIATLQPEAPALAFGVAGACGTIARGVVAVASTRLYSHHGIVGSGLLAASCALAVLLLAVRLIHEPTDDDSADAPA